MFLHEVFHLNDEAQLYTQVHLLRHLRNEFLNVDYDESPPLHYESWLPRQVPLEHES